MRIKIIAVGKAHDNSLRTAIEEYQKRLNKYVKLEWELLPNKTKEAECQVILRHVGEAYVILLDETGTQFDTSAFARRLEQLQNNAAKDLVFVIGGAYGVDESVKKRADYIWSLSPLVFPHQLVRLILTEQLYRAYDILNNGNYHHS